MSVIEFKKPETENRIWTCQCGCQTFELYEDNTTVCPLCGTVGEGHWREDLKVLEHTDAPVRSTVHHGSPEFARAAVMRDAKSDDTVILVSIKKSGLTRVWSDTSHFETDEQKEWLRQTVKGAAELMLNAPSDLPGALPE